MIKHWYNCAVFKPSDQTCSVPKTDDIVVWEMTWAWLLRRFVSAKSALKRICGPRGLLCVKKKNVWRRRQKNGKSRELRRFFISSDKDWSRPGIFSKGPNNWNYWWESKKILLYKVYVDSQQPNTRADCSSVKWVREVCLRSDGPAWTFQKKKKETRKFVLLSQFLLFPMPLLSFLHLSLMAL